LAKARNDAELVAAALSATRARKDVEFKPELLDQAPGAWLELLRDVAAMANSGGGVIRRSRTFFDRRRSPLDARHSGKRAASGCKGVHGSARRVELRVLARAGAEVAPARPDVGVPAQQLDAAAAGAGRVQVFRAERRRERQPATSPRHRDVQTALAFSLKIGPKWYGRPSTLRLP
jgi:hypothetical protein